MALLTIATQNDLRQYILRQLGEPIICVELSASQLDDVITDTIQDFQEYGYGEGNYEDFFQLTLTSGVDEYSLSGNNILDTTRYILPFEAGNINVLFTPTHVLLSETGLIHNLTTFGLVDHNAAQLILEEITTQFGIQFRVDWRPGREVLKVSPTPTAELIGILKIHRREEAQFLFNHRLVKKLATARAKKLWGEILKKHVITLPGGGTIQGAEIYSEGREDEKEILIQMKEESEPPDFTIA